MNRLEDRLRDAFGAAAETLRPDSMAGLPDHPREPRRSPGTGLRRLTPLGAAIAVAAIIAAASVITPLTLAGHQQPAPSTSRHNPPPGHRPASGHRPVARPVAEITVPQVVGMQASGATAVLLGAGLHVAYIEQTDAAVPPHIVIAQNPPAGARVRPGQGITLTIGKMLAPSSAPGTCASQSHPANFAGHGSPASSITVCPGRAPVGAVVHITLQGCDTRRVVAAGLEFLGPASWIGTSGGGDSVPFTAAGGDRAVATFRIPATYTGGASGNAPLPTQPVKPGDLYSFATYPASTCQVPFTVTP